MLHANATQLWSAARQIRSDKEPAAAENINPAFARVNISIVERTVPYRGRSPALPATVNILVASARPGLTKGNMAAKNIIRHPVLPSAKQPTPTTATSAATIPTLLWGMVA